MAYYVVTYGGERYANTDLYKDIFAGGEHAFIHMLTEGAAKGKKVLDEMLYSLTEEQADKVSFVTPEEQDLDAALSGIKDNKGRAGEAGRRISLRRDILSDVYVLNRRMFIKIREYPDANRYRIVPRMAALKVCGCWYVALDAVAEGVDNPIIVTLQQ
jgi:hypothetical protein